MSGRSQPCNSEGREKRVIPRRENSKNKSAEMGNRLDLEGIEMAAVAREQ